MSENPAAYGWASDFPEFRSTPPARVREQLQRFIVDASDEQVRAWRDAIPPLQAEVNEVLVRDSIAAQYSAILEYQLPMESRRPDVILLVGAGILVVELKGKLRPSQADIDQVAAYARDLRCYHAECADRPVVPILVPTLAKGFVGRVDEVLVAGPDALDSLVADVVSAHPGASVERAKFLAETAYRPLPTLVAAARELVASGTVRTITKAAAATEPTVEAIKRIAHQAALTKSRHLVLVSGVPGAGKTLVGLRAVHAHYLDDLAVSRADGKPTTPAVFLSGNGPLVEVLQYELRGAGGDGKTFVRGVKDYVKRYLKNPKLVPPEHVIVFDEAQRAFDRDMVAQKHKDLPAKSEPELMIDFADRIPEWCVVIGLIGSGQEIHVGEEAGVGQWRTAVEQSDKFGEWTVHTPPQLTHHFSGSTVPFERRDELNLDKELRFHLASDVHRFVDGILELSAPEELRVMSANLEHQGFHLRLTRDLEVARHYLRDRYRDNPKARFGLMASSRDRTLAEFQIPNGFQDTKNVRLGPWYGDPEDEPLTRSCRHLLKCVTEFGAQGLELDASLLAWGTDLMRTPSAWTDEHARKYKLAGQVKDSLRLRKNAYRVLLTRGREAVVVFIPPIASLNRTHDYLLASGFREIRSLTD